MAAEILIPLLLIVFAVLVGTGRRQLARGSNPQIANGAALLLLALVVGSLAFGLAASQTVY